MKNLKLKEAISTSNLDKFLEILNGKKTFAELESGDVLDYEDINNPDDNARAIVLTHENSKFGIIVRIIWIDTFEQDYILGITKIDGKQWKLA